MKIVSYSLFLGILIFCFCSVSNAQSFKKNDSIKEYQIQCAFEVIDNAGPCALISMDKSGRPRARAMDAFPPEKDLTIWMGTNPKSRKVAQIKNNPKVTVYYLEKDESSYVVINGTAILVNDQKLKNKYWKKDWEAFYPNNKDAYVLIKIVPDWIEVLSPKRGVNNDSITWRPPIIMMK